MRIQAAATPQLDWTGDAMAIAMWEEQTQLSDDLAKLDSQLDSSISELIADTEFKGKSNTTVFTRVGSKSPIRKIILVGLGKQTEANLDTIRCGAAAVTRIAEQEKVKTLAVNFPLINDETAKIAQVITEGIILALHKDKRFKSEPEKEELKLTTIDLLGLAGEEEAINRGEKIANGVILARELVAAPANIINPVTLAETAKKIAEENGLELEILEKEECEALGMGAFLGVAMASDLPPKFVHLTYKSKSTPKRKLAIVGKGLTFDSGGLNIKGAGSGIETMKMDMGGAAATFGAASAIAQLQPEAVEVHFISAITENMISGHAMHPGDILKASNGKTIEVNNTDAEGRLTLADALVFAEKLGVDAIVDLATLTGACIVALGDYIGGLWSSDEQLATEIKKASESAGEKFWQLPLEEPYFEIMKSEIADMKNTGSRAGGAITAALFLKQFVKDTPWAHLDIAGPVWTEKPHGVDNSGATGFPVRTLVNWVCQA